MATLPGTTALGTPCSTYRSPQTTAKSRHQRPSAASIARTAGKVLGQPGALHTTSNCAWYHAKPVVSHRACCLGWGAMDYDLESSGFSQTDNTGSGGLQRSVGGGVGSFTDFTPDSGAGYLHSLPNQGRVPQLTDEELGGSVTRSRRQHRSRSSTARAREDDVFLQSSGADEALLTPSVYMTPGGSAVSLNGPGGPETRRYSASVVFCAFMLGLTVSTVVGAIVLALIDVDC